MDGSGHGREEESSEKEVCFHISIFSFQFFADEHPRWLGWDGFHSVPNFMVAVWVAVECVPPSATAAAAVRKELRHEHAVAGWFHGALVKHWRRKKVLLAPKGTETTVLVVAVPTSSQGPPLGLEARCN